LVINAQDTVLRGRSFDRHNFVSVASDWCCRCGWFLHELNWRRIILIAEYLALLNLDSTCSLDLILHFGALVFVRKADLFQVLLALPVAALYW